MNQQFFARQAARRFFSLAACAARNGGFWVSASGGTANVVAGVISRETGVSFQDAHNALDDIGGEGWYEDMAAMQPWPFGTIPVDEDGNWFCRWGVSTIARAAVHPFRPFRAGERP